jgi:hypothetical protein
MAEQEDILGAEIAAIIKKELAPVLQRVAQLELAVAMADNVKRIETRLQQLEATTKSKTLRVVGDG